MWRGFKNANEGSNRSSRSLPPRSCWARFWSPAAQACWRASPPTPSRARSCTFSPERRFSERLFRKIRSAPRSGCAEAERMQQLNRRIEGALGGAPGFSEIFNRLENPRPALFRRLGEARELQGARGNPGAFVVLEPSRALARRPEHEDLLDHPVRNRFKSLLPISRVPRLHCHGRFILVADFAEELVVLGNGDV